MRIKLIEKILSNIVRQKAIEKTIPKLPEPVQGAGLAILSIVGNGSLEKDIEIYNSVSEILTDKKLYNN